MGEVRARYIWATVAEKNAQVGMVSGDRGTTNGDGVKWKYTTGGGWTVDLPSAHESSHANGGGDELSLDDLATAETDSALVLKPDGAGAVAWVPRGVPVLKGIDESLSPDYAWNLDGDLSALAGGLALTDLSAAAEAITFPHAFQRQVAWFTDSTLLEEATGAAGLEMLGDMTMMIIARLWTYSGTQYMVSHGKIGELEADNQLYSMRLGPGTVRSDTVEFAHESGAGVNEGNLWTHPVDVGIWQVITMVRDATAKTQTLYVDGVSAGAVGYTNNPTGGGSGNLTIGSFRPGAVTDPYQGWLGGIGLWSSKLTPAQITQATLHTLGEM